MQTKIHPQYYSKAKVICACGNTFLVGSTKKEIHVDVCSACHPFFTGRMRYVDTGGRVKKFQARQEAAKLFKGKKKKRKVPSSSSAPASLKEMLKKASR